MLGIDRKAKKRFVLAQYPFYQLQESFYRAAVMLLHPDPLDLWRLASTESMVACFSSAVMSHKIGCGGIGSPEILPGLLWDCCGGLGLRNGADGQLRRLSV